MACKSVEELELVIERLPKKKGPFEEVDYVFLKASIQLEAADATRV